MFIILINYLHVDTDMPDDVSSVEVHLYEHGKWQCGVDEPAFTETARLEAVGQGTYKLMMISKDVSLHRFMFTVTVMPFYYYFMRIY